MLRYLYEQIKFIFKKGYFVDVNSELYQTSFEELSEYFVDYVDYVKDKYRMKDLTVEFLRKDDAGDFELIWGRDHSTKINVVPRGWTPIMIKNFPQEEVDMWIAKYIKGKIKYIIPIEGGSTKLAIAFESQNEAEMFKLTWAGSDSVGFL